MIEDLVTMLIRAAACQTLMDPPIDRVFTTRTIGCVYYVATGNDAYLPWRERVQRGRELANREWWRQ